MRAAMSEEGIKKETFRRGQEGFFLLFRDPVLEPGSAEMFVT